MKRRAIVDQLITFTVGKVERTTERRFGAVLLTDIVDSPARSVSMGDAAWRDVVDGAIARRGAGSLAAAAP